MKFVLITKVFEHTGYKYFANVDKEKWRLWKWVEQ